MSSKAAKRRLRTKFNISNREKGRRKLQAQMQKFAEERAALMATIDPQIMEKIMDCIFPEKFYAGDVEPEGQAFDVVTNAPQRKYKPDMQPAQNLLSLNQIRENLKGLNLEDKGMVEFICSFIAKKNHKAVRKLARNSQLNPDKLTIIDRVFEEAEGPFGTTVLEIPVYSERYVADLKATIQNVLNYEMKSCPQSFRTKDFPAKPAARERGNQPMLALS